MNKDEMYAAGLILMQSFCRLNQIPEPKVVSLKPEDRLWGLASCAWYRSGVIHIKVKACAHIGTAGMAWSCPGYKVDRTPYGVLQHELGHHIDAFMTKTLNSAKPWSYWVHTGEAPLTGYLGTDQRPGTFEAEWFAEHFRLFVTNPDLSRLIAPLFHAKMLMFFFPVVVERWNQVLLGHRAPTRTLGQAAKIVNR